MTSIATTEPLIPSLRAARAALEKCTTIAEAKSIRDKAGAMRDYLVAQGLATAAQHEAAELVIRAERRIGHMLTTIPLSRGGRGKKGGTLAELGITKPLSARAQKLAAIPETAFADRIAWLRSELGKLTISAVLNGYHDTSKADRKLSQWDTRPETAKWFVGWAGVTGGMLVLEPSAGKGYIARAIDDVGAGVVAVEIDEARAAALTDEFDFDVVNQDFLDFANEQAPGGDGHFDMVVGNPPYENDADLEHILAMLSLAPVVCVICRLVLLEGKERKKRLWDQHSLTKLTPFSARESFEGDVDGTARGAFAAYRIERGPGRSVISWR